MKDKIIDIIVETVDGPFQFTCKIIDSNAIISTSQSNNPKYTIDINRLVVRPLTPIEGLEQRLPAQLQADMEQQPLDELTALEMRLWSKAYVAGFQIEGARKDIVKCVADEAIEAFRESFGIDCEETNE